MKELEARRYLEYLDAEPLRVSGRTTRRIPPRRTFGLTAVAVVSAVLLGLLSLSAFSGRLETAFWQEQTAQAALEDNLAPTGPLAPQDESDASGFPAGIQCINRYPQASPCCMGYWYYIVQALCAVHG